MTPPHILFLQGGWEGHRPAEVVARFAAALEARGARAGTITVLERLADVD